MKTRLFVLISGVLSIVLVTIALIVYIDVLKPNLYGADKAYNIGDYPKAISIYQELLNRNSKLVDAHMGLAKSFEKIKQLDNAYHEYLNGISETQNESQKVFIMAQLVKFCDRNAMYQEYKEFLSGLKKSHGKNWAKNHLALLSPTMIVLDDAARVEFSSFIYKITSYFDKEKASINFNNTKYDAENMVGLSNILSNVGMMPNKYTIKRNKTNKDIPLKLYQKKKYMIKTVDQVKSDIKENLRIKNKKSYDSLNFDENIEYIKDPDIFIYDDHVFFLKKNNYPNYDVLPSIDYVIDNFNGTYKIAGQVYIKQNHDNNDINKFINSSYLESFPKFTNWEYPDSFKLFYRFTATIGSPIKNSSAKFRFISISAK